MHFHRVTLLEGEIAPQLMRLSLPLLWGFFATSLFTVADTYYISQLGTLHLAALGFTLPVSMSFMGLLFGLSIGTTSCISRTFGEGDMQKVRQVSTDSLSLTMLIALLIAITGHFTSESIFRRMGAGDDILPLVKNYMSYWLLSLPFSALGMVGCACVRGQGNTRIPSRVMMVVAVANIIFEPFLIYGWGVFPEMGLAGASAAFAIVWGVASIFLTFYLALRVKVLSGNIFHRGILTSWKNILYVAVPSSMTNFIPPLAMGVSTWLVADIGKEAVAAMGVASRIEGFAMQIYYATGAGLAIFSGQNFGAGNLGRIREAFVISARKTAIWSLLMAGVFFVWSDKIPLLFDDDANVVRYTSIFLRIVPVTYALVALVVMSLAVLNATAKPLPAMGMMVVRWLVLYVPLSILGVHLAGFAGVVYAQAATNIFSGIMAYLVVQKRMA